METTSSLSLGFLSRSWARKGFGIEKGELSHAHKTDPKTFPARAACVVPNLKAESSSLTSPFSVPPKVKISFWESRVPLSWWREGGLGISGWRRWHWDPPAPHTPLFALAVG